MDGRDVRWFAAVAVVAVVATAPALSRASISGEARSDVHYEYEQNFCGVDVDYDTGWVPSGSDVQVRMQLRISCEFGAQLDGEGVMTWPPSMQVHFEGAPRGGEFTESIGVFFETRIRWDINVLGVTFRGEMPIPFVPRVDMGCLDRSTRFTPFLLSGNPLRPARLVCTMGPIEVFNLDLLDLLLPEISGLASARIIVKLKVDTNSYFQGTKFIISEHDQQITEEYGRAYVYPRAAPALDMTARYFADLSHQIIITLQPSVEFEVLGIGFGFDIIDVPITVPEITDEWAFDPAEMSFLFPDIDVPRTLDFGLTQVDRPRLKRFEVQNVGFEELLVRARSALPFGVDESIELAIDAPGMDDLTVSFDPEGEGTAVGLLRLKTNDPDEPWVDVQLLGEATSRDVGAYDDPDDCPPEGCPDRYYDDSGLGCSCGVAGASGGGWIGLAAVAFVLAIRRRKR